MSSAFVIIAAVCVATAFFSCIAVNIITKKAKASSLAQNRFLARMSHEIRTPITAVLGISEIHLNGRALPLHIEEAFGKIHISASILLGIVNDILDLSKIEAGKISVIEEKYELAGLISKITQLHMVHIGNKALDFQIEADENLPAFLIGDELRITQILNNLLSNAFKYTNEGLVVLSLARREDPRSDYIVFEISIKDTGCGMSPEQLMQLFDEYSRFHDKELPGVVGAGLGMSIVHNLVKLMGASIHVTSDVGLGTEVVVHLPQAVASGPLLGPGVVDEIMKSQSLSRFKNPNIRPEPMPYGKVLVVDDVETNLYVTQGLLMFYNLQIELCSSGEEAIEKVEAGSVYDIIFLDHNMPGLSGMEVAKKLRKDGYNNPIVALTANALIGQANNFLENGFNDFISKPIRTAHLNEILNKFIRDKQSPETIEAARAMSEPLPRADVDSFLLEEREELRRRFVSSQKNVMSDIRQALAGGEMEKAHRLAHDLKNLAAMIAEDNLSKTAEATEEILAAGNIPDLSLLEREFSAVMLLLEGPSSTDNSHEDRNKLLDKLQNLLAEQDAECLLLTDDLADIPETKILIRQIEEFEFEAALVTLHTLRDILE